MFVIFLATQANSQRPRILGLAHVAVYVSDFDKERAFYQDVLGYKELFSLKHGDGSNWISTIKINDQQYIELVTDDPHHHGQLSHLSLNTDNAAMMRDYLLSQGVQVLDQLHKGQNGNYFFSILDPDAHRIEIVEYQRNSWTAQQAGNAMPATRISDHIAHVGIRVGSTAAALKFYGQILGFRQFPPASDFRWQRHWIDLRVPDGDDYFELIPYREAGAADSRKQQDHIGLAVTDTQKAVTDLQSHMPSNSSTNQIDIEIDAHDVRRAMLLDPDGFRIEFTEPAKTIGTVTQSPLKSFPLQ